MCPYKDSQNLQALPCSWHAHPQDQNIRICDVCQNYYRIDEIVNPSHGLLSFIILAIVAMIFTNSLLFNQPGLDAPETQKLEPTDYSTRQD